MMLLNFLSYTKFLTRATLYVYAFLLGREQNIVQFLNSTVEKGIVT